MKMLKWAGIAAGAALLVGIGGIAAGDTDPTTTSEYKEIVAERDQAREDLANVEPEIKTVVETETVTETEEVTPQSCIDALDQAELVVGYAAEGFGYSADALEAASNFDVAGLDAATADMERLTPKVEQGIADYNEFSEDCRNAA